MSVLIVYTTCKTPEEARAIAARVIEKRVAACANIMPAHLAVYEWEGRVQTESETSIIIKTTDAQFEPLKAEILKLHSYAVPCVVAWPVEKGHAPFLEWVSSSVLVR